VLAIGLPLPSLKKAALFCTERKIYIFLIKSGLKTVKHVFYEPRGYGGRGRRRPTVSQR